MKPVSLIFFLMAVSFAFSKKQDSHRPAEIKIIQPDKHITWYKGAIIRGDSTQKKIALVFTADEFAEGGNFILSSLRKEKIKGSFFFTGRFYRNPEMKSLIRRLKKAGHYLGAHSDEHLLYCDWSKRDSLLVTKAQFADDLEKNYAEIKKLGIAKKAARLFIPPYEWYNDTIAAWTKEMGLQLINFTPGTRTPADYTWPGMAGYRGSEEIYQSVIDREALSPSGLNGFILLVHTGTDPRRTDKFYHYLPRLVSELKAKGYQFQKVDELTGADEN